MIICFQIMRINERGGKKKDPKSHLVHESPETNKSKFLAQEIKSMNKGFNDAQFKGVSRIYSVVQCLRLQEGEMSMTFCMVYSYQGGLD